MRIVVTTPDAHASDVRQARALLRRAAAILAEMCPADDLAIVDELPEDPLSIRLRESRLTIDLGDAR